MADRTADDTIGRIPLTFTLANRGRNA